METNPAGAQEYLPTERTAVALSLPKPWLQQHGTTPPQLDCEKASIHAAGGWGFLHLCL